MWGGFVESAPLLILIFSSYAYLNFASLSSCRAAMGQTVGCSLDDLPCCTKNTSLLACRKRHRYDVAALPL